MKTVIAVVSVKWALRQCSALCAVRSQLRITALSHDVAAKHNGHFRKD